MKKTLVSFITALTLVSPFASAGTASKADVQAFVVKAVQYAKDNGKEAALAAFMDKEMGTFFDGELYIFAYDSSGTVISHGAKPALAQKAVNLMKLKDPSGTFIIKELNTLAKAGGGWLEYQWENPQAKKVEAKLGYVLPVDNNWWLGSGMYK